MASSKHSLTKAESDDSMLWDIFQLRRPRTAYTTTEQSKEAQRLPDRPSTGGRLRERRSIESIGSLAASEPSVPEPRTRDEPPTFISRQSIERRLRSRNSTPHTSLGNTDEVFDVDRPEDVRRREMGHSRTSVSSLHGTEQESLTWRPSAGGLMWQNSPSEQHRSQEQHNDSRITGLGISWIDQPLGSDDSVGVPNLRARPLARVRDTSYSLESRPSTLGQGIGRSPLSYRSWRGSDHDLSFERSAATIQFPRASPPRITSDVGVMRGGFINDSDQEPHRSKSAPFVKKTFFGDELAKYISADSDVIRRDAARDHLPGTAMSLRGSTVTSMRDNFIEHIDTDCKNYQENRIISEAEGPSTRSPLESTVPTAGRSRGLPIRSSWRPSEPGVLYETDQRFVTSERPQYHPSGTISSLYGVPDSKPVQSQRASEVPQYIDAKTLRQLSDAYNAGLTSAATKPAESGLMRRLNDAYTADFPSAFAKQQQHTQREIAKSRHPGKLPLWKQLLLARAEREAIEEPSRYPRRSSSDLTISNTTIPPKRDTSRDFRLRRPNANVEWIKESYEFKYRQHRLAVANGKVTCYYLGLQPFSHFSPFLTISLCRASHYFSHPVFSILCRVFSQLVVLRV